MSLLALLLMGAAAGGRVRSLHSTTVEVTEFPFLYSSTTQHGTSYEEGFGFDAGADYYSYTGPVGSIADNTYTDAGSNSRQIEAAIWSKVGTNYMSFSILGTGVPNTDATFASVWFNGVEYARSDATYNSNKNGGSHWWWDSGGNPWPVGTRTLEITG